MSMLLPLSAVACRSNRLKARRKGWLKAHLWLGLVLGLAMSLFGLTGSILVFHEEIDAWLHPELMVVTAAPQGRAAYRPLAEWVEAGARAMPAQAQIVFGNYPGDPARAFSLNFQMPAAAAAAVSENWRVYVDPYRAQVLGKRLMKRTDRAIPETFIGQMFELHYALLLGEEVGYRLVSAMGALLIVSLLTGLLLWWPLGGKWRAAWWIKRRASRERFNYDLHKVAGLYTLPILLAVLFSGIYMDTPQHVVPLIELFSPATYRYGFRSTPPAGAQPLGMARAVALAERQYPEGTPDWIYASPAANATYTVCFDGVDRSGSWLQRRCVVLDRYSGKVLDLDDPTLGTAGEVFTHWQWPLHSGQAFGMAGRWLVFFSGLACPLLFVTGVIRWLQKRRVARRQPRPHSHRDGGMIFKHW